MNDRGTHSETVTDTKVVHLTGTKAAQILFMPNSEDTYRMLTCISASFTAMLVKCILSRYFSGIAQLFKALT